MIKQIHLDECNSTQDILKEQLSVNPSEKLLISCETQLAGRGRGDNTWQAMPGTLCFSINVTPHQVMSYTALELSVLTVMFFETKNLVSLKLKWPNDLWDESGKKAGGILVQGSQGAMAAGIGINITSSDGTFGSVLPKEIVFSKKELALEIANFIHQNRFQTTADLQRAWLSRCGHLNQMVTITEGGEKAEGIFQGIGDYGEALLCVNAETRRFFNGSLRPSY